MKWGLIEGMMGQERGDLYIVYSVYYAASPMAQQVQNMPAGDATQEMQVRFLGWVDPLEEEMATHSSILA